MFFLVVMLNFLRLFEYVIWIEIIFSWLVILKIVPISSPIVMRLYMGIKSITEPFYRPIRKRMNTSLGIDFSPMIVLMVVFILQNVIVSIGNGL